MKLFISALCLSLTACGLPHATKPNESSTQDLKDPQTQNTDGQQTKPNNSSMSVNLEGIYIHKEHKLAAPVYEFLDNKYRSIEIIGTRQDCILAKVIERDFDPSNSLTIILRPSRSNDPEAVLKELAIDVAQYSEGKKPAIFKHLCVPLANHIQGK